MKVIFLDIDGVLNCENGYKGGSCKYTTFIVDSEDIKNHYQQFYPPSKKYLNKVIDKTGAKVVISSTWRYSGIEFMRNVWENEGMSGEIIDITPDFMSLSIGEDYERLPRGLEIKHWLDKKEFSQIFWSKEKQQNYIDASGIENFIIIDDDTDMLYNQRDHFIHVKPSPRNLEGFNEENYDQAISVLSKNVVDLYYG